MVSKDSVHGRLASSKARTLWWHSVAKQNSSFHGSWKTAKKQHWGRKSQGSDIDPEVTPIQPPRHNRSVFY